MQSRSGSLKLVVGIVIAWIIMSCAGYDRQVEQALLASGANRSELEQVLEHYKDSTLKLEAAKFLIRNMVGFSSPDSSFLVTYRPFYQKCDSFRVLYQNADRLKWARSIDSLWNVHQRKYNHRMEYNSMIETVTAKQLIGEINLAFRSWEANAFSRDCSFDDFCEYILPFDRGLGFLQDNARARFYQLHKDHFRVAESRNVLVEVDSLLSMYQRIVFDNFYRSSVPIVSVDALKSLGGGKCSDRGAFNILLLSALGMPITTDFIPVWGNRGDFHSWNAFVLNGKTYAFDPFWGKDNWVYNRLYSNVGMYDEAGYGEFRAAKIYRRTYATHLESTLLNEGVSLEDIPPLFRDFKKIDVSSEYFSGADVTVSLTEIPPEGAKYAYLGVANSENWVPVQYGRIKGGKAEFRGMGKNIVYMPIYYKNGTIRQAASPFLLKTDGTVQVLEAEQLKDSIVIRSITPAYGENKRYQDCMVGTCITGLNKIGMEDTLCTISSILPIGHATYNVSSSRRHRFIRLNLPSDSIALGDISFHTSQGRIENVKVVSSLQSIDKNTDSSAMFDDFKSTVYRGKTKSRQIDVDLGKEYCITSIRISPYLYSGLFVNSWYELFYWEHGWNSLGKQRGNKGCLTFRNVPHNALLRVKQSTKTDAHRKERIFLYENGEVIWQ